MPTISVIVPVFNSEHYLQRCIDSICRQSFQDLEIILVDDGSKDSSRMICDENAEADQRIRVLHQKNRGVSAARNAGLDLACGEYVTFVDSDDWIEPGMYEHMIQTAREQDCDVVMCDCIKEFKNHSELYSHQIRSGFYNYDQLRSEYYPHLLMTENVEYPATISNWLIVYRVRYRQQLLPTASIRYVEGVRYSEDLLFGAEIMLQAKSFYYLKECGYYHYCMNDTSASHTFAVDKWDDYLRLYQQAQKRICNNEYDFSEQIDRMLLFFLYNAAGDVMSADSLSTNEKTRTIKRILHAQEVKKMFSRLRISGLPISWKLKVLTGLYKYGGIYSLIFFRRLFHAAE